MPTTPFERRAQLVAHVGEEARLGLHGVLGRQASAFQHLGVRFWLEISVTTGRDAR
jgi:hypothetical protein